jgi:carbohydrate-selective porin OprB
MDRYTGGQGIYTHTVSYEKDSDCPICSAGVVIKVDTDATLQQVGAEWNVKSVCDLHRSCGGWVGG